MALMSEKEAEILKKHICEFYNMKSENEELRTMLSQCAADIQKIKRVKELFSADPDKDYIHMEKIEKLLNKDYSDAQTNTDYIWRKLQENKKLKAMLKQVTDDIEKFRIEFKENNCRTSCEKCLFYNDGKDECVYKHMDEIKKMIDGDVNE